MTSGTEKNWQPRSGARPKAKEVLKIFVTALSALRKPAVAVPSIIYFIIQMAVMAFYIRFNSPPWSSFWAFFVEGVGANALGRYPHHILLLQPILTRFDIFFDIFVHVIFQGAISVMVFHALTSSSPAIGGSFRIALTRYHRLVITSLISSVAIFLLVHASRIVSGPSGGPLRLTLIVAGMLAGIAVQAAFLYSIPYIVLEDITALRAIRKSFSIAAGNRLVSFLIVLLPFILTLPSLFFDIKAMMVSLRLSPDFMIYNHVAREIMYTIATYLITAGSIVILIKYNFISARSGADLSREE